MMDGAGQPESRPKPDVSSLPAETLNFAHRMFDAARNGDQVLLQAVDAGLPANLTNDQGNSLLMLASYAGHADLVKGLIARGADPNRLNDRGQSMLAGAVFKGHDEVVRVLMEGGADMNAGTPNAIATAKMFGKRTMSDVDKSSSSGLTLVLPSLSALKQQNATKSKRKSEGLADQVKKPPRPMKLKPLKEVLTKLIAQIKKKDDYAFFLAPVNPSLVPKYSDVIKRPMDFGTMTTKVARGRYRSLEEFTSDLRLVTGNAKLFNPPGTIYYTEAERIEAWALDQIPKVAPTVIEYETDWNIEVEQDFDDPLDGQHVQIDDDSEDVRPAEKERSQSVASSQIQPSLGRRTTRGPQQQQLQKKSTNANKISESLEPDGHLPGYKDGVGVFPPGSDWAELMLALKLKGKKYRTKKERIRIEKSGPPLSADGSLDYTQLEDPFSILSYFVPDLPTRPHLVPLYPVDPSHPSRLAPTTLPIEGRPPPALATTSQDKQPRNHKRRHWIVLRSSTGRTKPKDREDDDQGSTGTPYREAHTVDWGSLASVSAALHAETTAREQAQKNAVATVDEAEEEEAMRDVVRDGLQEPTNHGGNVSGGSSNAYWTPERAADAEKYVQEVVYGGVDGYAYVRSLAEFVGDGSIDHQTTDEIDYPSLGMPLARWVERHIVEPLTGGRHSLLRETVRFLANPPPTTLDACQSDDWIRDRISVSLYKYPTATAQLASLKQLMTHQIDMGALILTPAELFGSEEVWAGQEWKRRKMEEKENGAEGMQTSNGKDAETMEYEGPEMLQYVMDHTAGVIDALDRRLRARRITTVGQASGPKNGSWRALKRKHEEENEEYAGRDGGTVDEVVVKEEPKEISGDDSEEDSTMKNLRLNLLALAKRAPLDKIARLPADLVPEHIRSYVPTLG